MAHHEIMIDMEHGKHGLQQIEVSKSDKLMKPERLLLVETTDTLPWKFWKHWIVG